MASNKEETLYIGVTGNLIRRIYQHKNDLIDGFTKRYGIHKLVYYEIYDSITAAITREKQLKYWKRKYKIDLIQENNLIGTIYTRIYFKMDCRIKFGNDEEY